MLWKDLPNVGKAGLHPQHVPGAASRPCTLVPNCPVRDLLEGLFNLMHIKHLAVRMTSLQRLHDAEDCADGTCPTACCACSHGAERLTAQLNILLSQEGFLL